MHHLTCVDLVFKQHRSSPSSVVNVQSDRGYICYVISAHLVKADLVHVYIRRQASLVPMQASPVKFVLRFYYNTAHERKPKNKNREAWEQGYRQAVAKAYRISSNRRCPRIVATASKRGHHASARTVCVVRVVPTADSRTERLCVL